MVKEMADSGSIPLVMWSIIAGILILVSGLSYKAYLRRKKDETPSP